MNKTPIEWTDWSVNPLKMRMPDGTLINVCVHKSEGCRFCYAEGIVKRWWNKEWGEFPGYTAALLKIGTPVLVKAELEAVIRLSNRIAQGKADPKENKVFWNDMTDEYLEYWPDEFLDQIWAVRALTQNLVHQVLTKRPDRMLAYFTDRNRDWDCLREAIEFNHLFYAKTSEMMSQIKAAGWLWETYVDNEGFKDGQLEYHGTLPLPNVIVMTSVENQTTADERIPQLLKIPAAWHGLSAEPLLGEIDISRWLEPTGFQCLDPGCVHWQRSFLSEDEQDEYELTEFSQNTDGNTVQGDPICIDCGLVGTWTGYDKGVDWVIFGFESGASARQGDLDWIRRPLAQCKTSEVKRFVKQLGARPIDWRHDEPEVPPYEYFFTKKGGDISEWPEDLRVREFPSVTSRFEPGIAEVSA